MTLTTVPGSDAAGLADAPDACAFSLSLPATGSTATRFAFELDLSLRHAGRRSVVVRGEIQGPAGAPVIVVAGGISADRHVAASGDYPEPGWWDAQVGPGQAIDTRRRRVLAIDWLGADGALDAPIDSADQADVIAAVLDQLEIAGIEAFIGASYGAMVGLQFAARHGGRVERLLAISGGDRSHPFASAWRALQRQVVALGQDEGGVARGLSLARQWAMLSYRTPEEFAERFSEPAQLAGDRARCAAEDYLEACGRRYAARWTSTAFLRLSESIDLHRVDPAEISTPTTLIAVAQDRLVPLADLRALAATLPVPAQLHVLDSTFGHDAFLTETVAIAGLLRQALAGGAQ